MEAQDKQADGIPAPEVTAALVEFARLSHRIELAVAEAHGKGITNSVPTLLLERLIVLCKAQGGAILFPIQRLTQQKPSWKVGRQKIKDASLEAIDRTPPTNWGDVLDTSGVGRHKSSVGRDTAGPYEAWRTFHTMALHNMSEGQALTLLEGFSPDGEDIQLPAGDNIQSPGQGAWIDVTKHASITGLLCRLPVSRPNKEAGHQGASVEDAPHAGPTTEESEAAQDRIAVTLLPASALLVLVWAAEDEKGERTDGQNVVAPRFIEGARSIEEAEALLPFVADAAGAVIMDMLLVERIYELEASADRKALREMELLKAELLATVSHELRSPLASIKGYASTLLRHERRISREERHEFLLAINEASDRLALVIDRLLEMSQLETGGMEIEPVPVNLAYLVREAILAVEQRLSTFQIGEHLENKPDRFTFTLELEDEQRRPTGKEPVIWADRHRLREVLDNLLENAIHYSPEGGSIEVILRPIFSTGKPGKGNRGQARGTQQVVEICVCDHGIGIPPAHIERIFDRFHRVDTRLTREVNGLGLGLTVSKRIIELHGGAIWAESEFGEGTTFHIWLPVDARAGDREGRPYARA